jgi:hypothetical protein
LTLVIRIKIPPWLEPIALWPLLAYRRLRYGYPFRKIPLTQGKYAIVDPDDYQRLAKYKWRLCKTKGKNTLYAERSIRLQTGRYSRILMHRQVLNPSETRNPRRTRVTGHERPATNLVIDHINRNGLDNREANIRPATVAQNAWNSRKRNPHSKYKGIWFAKDKQKFRACITANGKRHHLGYFADEISAAKAYDEAAKKYHGEFAVLNFTNI